MCCPPCQCPRPHRCLRPDPEVPQVPGVEEVEENKSWDVGPAPFSPFLPAAGIAAGTEEEVDAEQQRKREHRGAGLDVGVRAERKQERLDKNGVCIYRYSNKFLFE